MEDKQVSFFRFEDLRVYAKALDYSGWLLEALGEPRNEAEKTLCRSFVTSAMDISLNIAEGSSRSKNQFDHFLKIAKSAIRECICFTAVAEKVGLLSGENAELSRSLLMEQTRMVGALIISLQRATHRGDATSSHSDDYDGDDTEIADDKHETDFFDRINAMPD